MSENQENAVWSQSIAKARELRRKGAGLLWDRVKILIGVYKDSDFLAHCDSLDRNAEDVLDDELSDTCSEFLPLKITMEYFPEKNDWLNTKIDVLRAKAEEMCKKSRHDGEEITRDRPSWKERYMELKRKYDASQIEWQLKHDALQKSHDVMEARFEELSKVLQFQATH